MYRIINFQVGNKGPLIMHFRDKDTFLQSAQAVEISTKINGGGGGSRTRHPLEILGAHNGLEKKWEKQGKTPDASDGLKKMNSEKFKLREMTI